MSRRTHSNLRKNIEETHHVSGKPTGQRKRTIIFFPIFKNTRLKLLNLPFCSCMKKKNRGSETFVHLQSTHRRFASFSECLIEYYDALHFRISTGLLVKTPEWVIGSRQPLFQCRTKVESVSIEKKTTVQDFTEKIARRTFIYQRKREELWSCRRNAVWRSMWGIMYLFARR